MIDNREVLSIILARSGSKGISQKNIKKLKGKPLISYTIEEAIKSKYIDRVIVSTDDFEIRKVAKQCGAEVPFIRPKELATDEATSEDAMIHAINWLKLNEKYKSDYVILLQPTSPLRKVQDIDGAIEKFARSNGDSLLGLCEANKHPYWMMEVKNEEAFYFISEIGKYTRRQDLPKIYNINGAIYITKTKLFLQTKCRWCGKIIPYVMPKERSIDIDDMLDWKLAELLLEEGNR
ncbi:acylneuraminate cytidylyltransferase [Orenia metallireducens]|uniref:Acylneuraminate cytidylyltransferase n=1 Tax=Orenia metallireducens TaxID=1413210 RepID=A0A1C0AB92_9FIRM|nr:acylneuraminate cytidylyltransferase family protein [Orenia metallireducens]OCL27626.1 acylneuraminate cytidylyltransferase [Orenia metallireducens]